MALHTGTAQERDGDYFGQPVNRVARLLSAGHGGQTLISAATQELVRDTLPAGCTLVDLGDASLKDLARPERVYQLGHPELASEFPPLRTLNSGGLPNNLPQQLTSFIGREKETADVEALLVKNRLLTLLGTGGAGKTRLALQAAADLLDGEGDGVWLVELAPLSDPALVPGAVAQVLGVKEAAGQSIEKTLVNSLKSKRLLLVLDNCEHILAACCSLATDLLRSCPGVHILATSREPLGAPGEQVYRIPSLAVPEQRSGSAADGNAYTAESLSQYESVRLFVERAKTAQPSFGVNDSNAPAVAQLCFQLDGIPLAIELAAARVRSMSVEQMNARLDHRFKLLTGGSRMHLPRHQTLKALIDWSYDLLNEPEKSMLMRLSVFAGGWTLESAESVCRAYGIDDWEVLDSLTSLTDKSLIVYEESGAGADSRYRPLETIRQYACDRLDETGDGSVAGARNAHRDWCIALAENAVPHLRGAEQARWLAYLELEHDNLRAGLSWCEQLTLPAGGKEMLRLSVALAKFWLVRGHYTEGRTWLMSSLQKNDASADTNEERSPDATELILLRAKALYQAAILAEEQGDYAEAAVRYTQSLSIQRTLDNQQGIANALQGLGNVAYMQCKYSAAHALHLEMPGD